MTTYEACRSDLLIFAVNPSRSGTDAVLNRLIAVAGAPVDQQVIVVGSPGEALRLVHRHQPRLLFLRVEAVGLKQSTLLIDAIHRRRPHLPLVAMAPRHDEAVERQVRAAGAAYYFALDDQADDQLLGNLLREFGIASDVPRSGLSPPRSRGRPPARRRYRTGRSSFG